MVSLWLLTAFGISVGMAIVARIIDRDPLVVGGERVAPTLPRLVQSAETTVVMAREHVGLFLDRFRTGLDQGIPEERAEWLAERSQRLIPGERLDYHFYVRLNGQGSDLHVAVRGEAPFHVAFDFKGAPSVVTLAARRADGLEFQPTRETTPPQSEARRHGPWLN